MVDVGVGLKAPVSRLDTALHEGSQIHPVEVIWPLQPAQGDESGEEIDVLYGLREPAPRRNSRAREDDRGAQGLLRQTVAVTLKEESFRGHLLQSVCWCWSDVFPEFLAVIGGDHHQEVVHSQLLQPFEPASQRGVRETDIVVIGVALPLDVLQSFAPFGIVGRSGWALGGQHLLLPILRQDGRDRADGLISEELLATVIGSVGVARLRIEEQRLAPPVLIVGQGVDECLVYP